MYNQAFAFCEKVKERLSSVDDYQAFLKCLNIYINGIIKRSDLLNLVCLSLRFTLFLVVILVFLWIRRSFIFVMAFSEHLEHGLLFHHLFFFLR